MCVEGRLKDWNGRICWSQRQEVLKSRKKGLMEKEKKRKKNRKREKEKKNRKEKKRKKEKPTPG